MGGLFLSSKDEYAMWTGGKPKPDWMGLNMSAPTSMCSLNQICPMYATLQVKGYNLWIEGLETKLTLKDSDFLDFTILVFDQLENTGMDLVSYLPDPLEPTNMVSVSLVSHWSTLRKSPHPSRPSGMTMIVRMIRLWSVSF